MLTCPNSQEINVYGNMPLCHKNIWPYMVIKIHDHLYFQICLILKLLDNTLYCLLCAKHFEKNEILIHCDFKCFILLIP